MNYRWKTRKCALDESWRWMIRVQKPKISPRLDWCNKKLLLDVTSSIFASFLNTSVLIPANTSAPSTSLLTQSNTEVLSNADETFKWSLSKMAEIPLWYNTLWSKLIRTMIRAMCLKNDDFNYNLPIMKSWTKKNNGCTMHKTIHQKKARNSTICSPMIACLLSL